VGAAVVGSGTVIAAVAISARVESEVKLADAIPFELLYTTVQLSPFENVPVYVDVTAVRVKFTGTPVWVVVNESCTWVAGAGQ
jgi:hypothetical protein